MRRLFRLYCSFALWWHASPRRRAIGQRRMFGWGLVALGFATCLGFRFFWEWLAFKIWDAPLFDSFGAGEVAALFATLVLAAAVAFLLYAWFGAARGAVALIPYSPTSDEDPLRAAFLRAHGFEVVESSGTTLKASRGVSNRFWLSLGVESEFRDLPLFVQIREDAITVIGMGGVFAQLPALTRAAAVAIAGKDDASLEGVDDVIPQRQSGISMGPLSAKMFLALVVSVGVALAATIPIMATSMAELVDRRAKAAFVMEHNAWHEFLRERLVAPEREALVAAFEGAGAPANNWDAIAREAAERVRGQNVVIAVIHRDGRPEVVLPRNSHPLWAEIQQQMQYEGQNSRGWNAVRAVTGGAVMPISDERLSPWRGVGSSKTRLFLGGFYSYEELAKRASGVWRAPLEVVYFDAGHSALRLDFKDKKAVVADAGKEVVTGDIPWFGGVNDDAYFPLKLEEWRGKQRFLLYSGDRRASGFVGRIMVFPEEAQVGGLQRREAEFLFNRLVPIFAALCLAALIAALLLSRRLTAPLFGIRDALKRIAVGDYSGRVSTRRRDEVGQLQRLVDYTAEQLQRREAIKELMGMYLSKQVADRIIKTGAAASLGGVRTEVSVLFADVRGFTTYSETHPPEQVTRTLNEYFEVMVDVVAAHDGVLDKFIGDGIMVVFGAPLPQADHAMRAVITALEMQAHLATLNLRRAQRGDEPIAIGVGVNTGIAISGNLGSLKRMEFTVVGDAVNTAARLESKAQRGEVLIGKNTYSKVADAITAEPLGMIPVKGKAQGVEVWKVTGLQHDARLRDATALTS